MNFLGIFQRLRQMIVDLWQRTEKRDRNRFFIISGVSVAVLAIAMILLTRTTYVQLASGSQLDPARTAEITAALSEQGIAYRTDASGAILVPEKSRIAAANYLSVNGIPSSMERNTDIYALGTGLTTNNAQQEQYRIYQLEQYIEMALRSIDGVRHAQVILAVPQEKVSIVRNNQPPVTASVQLITDDGTAPSRNTTEAIRAITANAVAGLDNENVAVSYQGGLLLTDRTDTYEELYKNRNALKQQIERDHEQGVRALLDTVLGYDNYTVKANVTLDFDQASEQHKIYTPSTEDGEGMVESMQTLQEIAEGYGVPAWGPTGMDWDGGGGDDYTEIEQMNRSYYEKSTTTLNYLVNETITLLEKASGTIDSQTFSIVVDKEVFPEDNKTTTNIQNVVGGALGLVGRDAQNRISVMYEEFVGKKGEEASREAYRQDQERARMMDLIRLIALYVVIGACVIVLILKTYSLLKKEPTEEELLAGAIEEGYDPEMDEMAALVEMATLGEITEAPKSPFRVEIEKFIDKNPDAVANLLRNWLNEA